MDGLSELRTTSWTLTQVGFEGWAPSARCHWLCYLRRVGHHFLLCFAIRILVISRVKAAGSSTSAFASASGLSRTMAMSISPPSFWIRAGRPACICARIATALFHTGCVPIPPGLLAPGCQFVVGPCELPVSPMHG